MATMRAEAVDMIYNLTESQVTEAVNYLKGMLAKNNNAKSEEEEQRERDMAFERLEKSIHENKHHYGDDFDWRKEYIKGLEEKYGVIA